MPCAAEMELEGLKPGSHTLSVRAVDKAGNKDETPVDYAWEISMDAAPRVAGGGIGCSQAGASQLLPFAGLLGLSLPFRRKRRA